MKQIEDILGSARIVSRIQFWRVETLGGGGGGGAAITSHVLLQD